MALPLYETPLFQNYQNERAKLGNAVSDLRFMAVKYCQHFNIFPYASKDTVFEMMAVGLQYTNIPGCDRILQTKAFVEKCAPDQAAEIVAYAWDFTHRYYEKIRKNER